MKCGCGLSIIYIPTKKSVVVEDEAQDQETIKKAEALVAEADKVGEEHVKALLRRPIYPPRRYRTIE